jgi:hypothetical protein
MNNHLRKYLPNSNTGPSTYRKIVNDLFAYQKAIRHFLLAWDAESHDNVVEHLSSKAHLT